MGEMVHRLLYRMLSLSLYLRVVSGSLFLYLRLGLGRYKGATEYIYHLDKLISEGGVAIDIGANLGYYSRPLSRIVGANGVVHSVEPVPVIFDVLRRNLSGRGNVVLHNVALGASVGEVAMSNDSVAECGYFGTGRNGIGGAKSRGAVEFTARMVRGSELFAGLEKIDLIKCDIEGYEMVVMPEMQALIARHRPVVLIESGGEQREQIIEMFENLGYCGYTLELGEELPLRRGISNNSGRKDIIFRAKE